MNSFFFLFFLCGKLLLSKKPTLPQTLCNWWIRQFEVCRADRLDETNNVTWSNMSPLLPLCQEHFKDISKERVLSPIEQQLTKQKHTSPGFDHIA